MPWVVVSRVCSSGSRLSFFPLRRFPQNYTRPLDLGPAAIGLSFLPFWLFLDLLTLFPQVEVKITEGRKNDKKPIVEVPHL